MSRINHVFITVFLTALCLSTGMYAQTWNTTIPERVGMSADRLERLTETMESYVNAGQLPGAVVLIARKGEIPYYQAFGKLDKENNIDMPKDAIFRIASQTKAIISTTIMVLQEEGKLLIQDPVGKYLPAFNETTVAVKDGDSYRIEKAKRKITIRDLLTHTSGIGYGNGVAGDKWEEAGIQGWYFADRDESIGEVVNRMASLPMDAHPGTQFIYGYSTDILGAVAEAASGKALDVLVKEKIFDPVGMHDTHFYLPWDKKNRLSVVYSLTDKGLERAPEPGMGVGQGAYVDGPRKCFSGGAGLLSTAMDYAKFLQMMLNGGEFQGNRILSPTTVELMTINHLGDLTYPWDNGMGFGLGFSIVENMGTRGVPGPDGEFGWGGAYHSHYWVNPEEELVVVYFTQIIPANRLDDHQKLRALVYQSIID